METSKQPILQDTGAKSTFLPEGSLANLFQSPESSKEQQTTVISGRKCFGQYKRFGRAGSLEKMCRVLLAGPAGWCSSRCVLTWKAKGTKYNRLLFQLAPSTPRIEGIESGLLPTPTAMMLGDQGMDKLDQRRERIKKTKGNGNGFGTTLNEMLKKELIPTPVSNDAKNITLPKSQTNWDSVVGYAIKGILPTPTASMYTIEDFVQAGYSFKDRPEYSKIYQASGVSRLSPLYVSEMMGYPLDYLIKPFQDGSGNL